MTAASFQAPQCPFLLAPHIWANQEESLHTFPPGSSDMFKPHMPTQPPALTTTKAKPVSFLCSLKPFFRPHWEPPCSPQKASLCEYNKPFPPLAVHVHATSSLLTSEPHFGWGCIPLLWVGTTPRKQREGDAGFTEEGDTLQHEGCQGFNRTGSCALYDFSSLGGTQGQHHSHVASLSDWRGGHLLYARVITELFLRFFKLKTKKLFFSDGGR